MGRSGLFSKTIRIEMERVRKKRERYVLIMPC